MEPLPHTHLRYAAWSVDLPPHGTGLSILIDGFRDGDDAQAFLQFLLPPEALPDFTVLH
jgi:hypothetical protein